jgi:ferredoxin
MSRHRASGDSAPRLVVDPISCEAVGVCAQLAPAVVDLDRWGYPVVPGGVLTRSERRAARRAVRGCPRKALALVSPTGRS